jgi:hypothetical protein
VPAAGLAVGVPARLIPTRSSSVRSADPRAGSAIKALG